LAWGLRSSLKYYLRRCCALGISGLIRTGGSRVSSHLRLLLSLSRVQLFNSIYDWRRGTNTAAGVPHISLEMPEDVRRMASWYVPMPTRIFHYIIDALPIHPADYLFVDIGAGKGKVLMAAAEHGFSELIGVEADSRLSVTCRANILSCELSAYPCTIVNQDVMEWELPDSPAVAFLYSPFTRDGIERFMNSLESRLSSRSTSLILVFVDDIGAQSQLSVVVGHCEASKNWQSHSISSLPNDRTALFPMEAAAYSFNLDTGAN